MTNKKLRMPLVSAMLRNCPLPDRITQCTFESTQCKSDIQKEYDTIVNCILKASESITRHKRGVQKDWWTPELTNLKEKSVAIHNLWITEGRPRHGATHWERLSVRATYKKAIRFAKRAPKEEAWNKLHLAMEAKDSDSFWKWWRSVYNKNYGKSAPVVENCTTKESIAEVFKTVFKKNAQPNNHERVIQMQEFFQSDYRDFGTSHHNNCDCNATNITLATVIDAACCMKSGKCADDDGLQAEHLLNAPLDLLTRRSFLFNFMLTNSGNFDLGSSYPSLRTDKAKSVTLEITESSQYLP